MPPLPYSGRILSPEVKEQIGNFESLWEKGQRPSIDDILSACPEEVRFGALVELIHAELEFRIRNGEPARLKEYLARYPQLDAQPEVVSELLTAEFRHRKRHDPSYDSAECSLPCPQHIGEMVGQPPTFIQPSPPQAGQLVCPPGYEILGELGQGGMGTVYRARACALDRPVALKSLKVQCAGYPELVQRFLREARITARLQHPGIPPVYEVGELPDHRPFLAMKVIEGRTLQELLQEQGPGAGRWLGVFEAICQALAYAHSQGIIHRDLKPANIMVGAFAEVQVMDWGLAKTLSTILLKEDDPLATTHHSTTPEMERTQTGAVLGTPTFMPPEQAIGAIDKLDCRSDVFGLGAILCALLTGKPPFIAPDAESARQLAARGEVQDAFARLDECGAEPELVALAKRCLSPRQEDRPANAQTLAAEIAQLRRAAEERARHAEMDKVRVEERAEQQKRRQRLTRWATIVVIGVLLAGIAGTTIGLWRSHESHQQEVKQRHEAEAARDGARQRFRLALDTINHVVVNVQNQLETRPGTQDLRKKLLLNAQQELRKLRQEALQQGTPDSTLIWAHLRMGEVELILGNTQAALAEYQAGHELAQHLAEAEPDSVQAQRDLAASLNKLGDVSLKMGDTKAAFSHFSKSQQILKRVAEVSSTNADQHHLAVSLSRLGDVSQEMGDTKSALEHFTKCQRIFQQQAEADPTNAEAQRYWTGSLQRLGSVALDLGDTKSALVHFRKCQQIAQQLADADPKNAEAQRDLTICIEKVGEIALRLDDTKTALLHFTRSLEIRQQLAEADPKNGHVQRALSVSLEKRGDVALQMGDTKTARVYYTKALEVSQRLADADLKNAELQRHLSTSLDKVGELTLQLHDLKEASQHLTKSLEIRERLAEADPKNAKVQRDLSVSLNKLGDLAIEMRNTKSALEHFTKALTIRQQLADADPKNAEAQRDLAMSLHRLGNVALMMEDTKTALKYYTRFHEVCQTLAKADPKDPQAQRDLAISLSNRGEVAMRMGDTTTALGYFTKSLDVTQRRAEADAMNAEAQRDLTASLEKVGDVTRQLHDPKGALQHYTQSLEIRQRLADVDPTNAQAQTDLFIGYWKIGKAEQERHEYGKALSSLTKGRDVLKPLHEKKLLVGQFKNAITHLDREIAFCQNAEKAIANVNFAFTQRADPVAELLDSRVRALLVRGHLGDAIRTAECWRDWAEKRDKDRASQRYNVARALALCAAADSDSRKELLIRKVVAVLTKLRDAGYFADDKRLARFAQDNDFAGVRSHPAFAKFAESLKK